MQSESHGYWAAAVAVVGVALAIALGVWAVKWGDVRQAEIQAQRDVDLTRAQSAAK